MPSFASDDLQRALSKSSDHVKSVCYVPTTVRTVAVLACALSHGTDIYDHVPRIQVTGPFGSGKSTFLSTIQWLAQCPVRNGGQLSTQWAFRNDFRAFAEKGKVPTSFVDETRMIFGNDGSKGSSHPLYSVCTEGYSIDGSPVKYQENKDNVEYSCYQVAFLGSRGERALPEDVLDRSIKCVLTKKPDGMRLRRAADPAVREKGRQYGGYLASSISAALPNLKGIARNNDWYSLYGLDSRDADIWVGMFAIAFLAGGPWPGLMSDAYSELGACNARNLPTELQLMVDILAFMRHTDSDPEQFKARDLITYLIELGRKCYTFDGSPYSIKRFGMELRDAGITSRKSSSTVWYRVSPAWMIEANKVAFPKTTEVHDPDNDWEVLEQYAEPEPQRLEEVA